jgi:hypothetical protein
MSLTKKVETQLLSQREWDLKQSISDRLAQLLRGEGGVKMVPKGENN